ncbi:MAG TPA: phosphatase PAP2 family protein [Stellaceae bacterium]|nr:phosphatase PAP2 family protein [Stellaceae bacterium]
MRFLLNLVTDLGDSALLLPASALLFAYLLYLRAASVARIWVMALALCALLTLLLKVAFYTCGMAVPVLAMRSPSGHTSLSTTFYGCAALMMTGDKERATQVMVLAGGTFLALAVALSRVLLHAHTMSEVALGLTIGVLCVVWFGSAYLGRPPLSVPWRSALLGVGLLLLITHGLHWNFEWMVARIAALLRSGISICA